MKHVENSLLQGELLPIIKPLIIQILEEEILSKGSSSLLTNGNTKNNGIVNGHASVPINYEVNTQIIKAKELELIERVIRLEEQSNYIREDIKKVHIDMKELRQDMDNRFMSMQQDMDKRFMEAKQDMKELRQDMDTKFSRLEKMMFVMFGFVTTILSTLITVFHYIK